MNEHQVIALTDPCTYATECPARKFSRLIGRWGTILTVNK